MELGNKLGLKLRTELGASLESRLGTELGTARVGVKLDLSLPSYPGRW